MDEYNGPDVIERKQNQSKSVVHLDVNKPKSVLGRKITPRKEKVRNPSFLGANDDGLPLVNDVSIEKIDVRSFADIVIDEAVSEDNNDF